MLDNRPAWQHQPALRPREDPGDGAQVLDALGRLARGRAAADVEGRDFGNDRRLPEVGGESGRFIDQAAIGDEGALRKFIHHGMELLGRFNAVLVVGQAGFERCREQHFEVAAARVRVAVLGRDDLALFGQADLPGHGAGGLGEYGVIAGAAAASDRPAAAVEQAQPDAMPAADAGQFDLGLVQFPARGQEAAILVAVGVAEHDLLRQVAAGCRGAAGRPP